MIICSSTLNYDSTGPNLNDEDVSRDTMLLKIALKLSMHS